jgi:transposase
MKNKPTQVEVVREMLLNKQEVTASTVYKETKKRAGVGSVNHHKLIALLRDEGLKIIDTWHMNEKTKTKFKSYKLKSKK